VQPLQIRQGQPVDASRCVEFMQALSAEKYIGIGLSPGEFTLTVDQEAQFIQGMLDSENSLFLVAELESRLVGILTLQGGKRKSTRHAATLGISVAKDYRDQGIGRTLMQTAIDWVKINLVLKRIELYVVTSNQPAIHLYEAFGFIQEGHRRKALFRDGQYHDDLLIARLFFKD
jgi:RimJ/RimL family protein N-acetyltransferase